MKWPLFGLAWLSFLLGMVGAFLPLLPTTPFLILSAYLFSKSSPRFHAWLLSLPYAGPAIIDWDRNRVIRPRAKLLSTVMLVVSIATFWVLTDLHIAFKVLLSLLLSGVGFFVLTRKSH